MDTKFEESGKKTKGLLWFLKRRNQEKKCKRYNQCTLYEIQKDVRSILYEIRNSESIKRKKQQIQEDNIILFPTDISKTEEEIIPPPKRQMKELSKINELRRMNYQTILLTLFNLVMCGIVIMLGQI